MNKYIKYAALLTILSLAMLFSCQKNEEAEVGSKQQFQMTESAQIAYNKLVAFKQALDNPQKSTTSMQLDSAEWYVEAFYNVTQGYPDSVFGKFEVDTMFYTLPLDENQMVGISDLGLLLDNMENHLNSLLTQTGSEVAHMVVGDVVVDFSGRSDPPKPKLLFTQGLGLEPVGFTSLLQMMTTGITEICSEDVMGNTNGNLMPGRNLNGGSIAQTLIMCLIQLVWMGK